MWYYYKFTDGVKQTKSDSVFSTPLAKKNKKHFSNLFFWWILHELDQQERRSNKRNALRKESEKFLILAIEQEIIFPWDFYIRRDGKCASTICPGVAQIVSPTEFSFAPPHNLSQLSLDSLNFKAFFALLRISLCWPSWVYFFWEKFGIFSGKSSLKCFSHGIFRVLLFFAA